MNNQLYEDDIPENLNLGDTVAVDTETMGLNIRRDRLCLVQLSSGDGNAHLVKISSQNIHAPNLCKLLTDKNVLKIFHYGRFDIAVLLNRFEILCSPVYCTKIASKLVRTFTDKHGLKNILQDLLSVDISKLQQSSDWGSQDLTIDQKNYAASDVLYLHQAREKLNGMLIREDRMKIANACFDFLPRKAELDLLGWSDQDIFSHS